MPILRCQFAGGGVADIPITIAMIPRINNAMRMEEIQLDVWDAMPKKEKRKMQRDYDWFNKLLTKAKLSGVVLATGVFQQTLGHLNGNNPSS